MGHYHTGRKFQTEGIIDFKFFDKLYKKKKEGFYS